MIRVKHLFYTLVLCSFHAFQLSAQTTGKHITKQNLSWYCYFNTLEFSPKWFLTTEIQERRFMNPDKQHQLLFRNHLHYRLGNNWDTSVGFTYFLQSPQDPHSTETLMVPELRPHIQYDYKQPCTDRFTITHRYKTEFRFIRKTEDGELAHGYTFFYRFRYRLGLELELFKINEQPLKLKVNDEILLNAGKNITLNRFDQNRLYGGLHYTFNKNLALEAGYMNWFQQRVTGDNFFDRDIIRIVFHHKINLGKEN